MRQTTTWLTLEERGLVHKRIQRDTVGKEENHGARAGFMQAIRDRRLDLFCLMMQNLHLSACGFNNFFPTVVGSLGFDRTLTLILTCPPYLVSGIAGIVVGLTSGKMNERIRHITLSMGVAAVGFIISCVTLNTAARYVSYFLIASGAYAVNSVILGWIMEKKGISLSIVNVVANASYIYTPYLYPKSDGPCYLTAMSANTAFAVGTVACAWVMKIWLVRTNKKNRAGGTYTRLAYAY
ncbi:MFS general substrate transporter [Aureobasidium subglaciale]|nr:MFS general substrate transporter [Aureobasidium subglaciale]